MSVILTKYKGESTTFGFVLPDSYDLANMQDVKIYIGSKVYSHVMDNVRTVKAKLTSEDTQALQGRNSVIFHIDDAVFGIRKILVGEFQVDNIADNFRDESINLGYDVLVMLQVDVDTIEVDSVLYNVAKGDSAFASWLKLPENVGKDWNDYIAYLREPMTAAIEEGEQTAAEWAIDEAERRAEELIRKADEEERRAAEVIREQVKDATIIAKDEANQATIDANDAADYARIQGDYANEKGNLADANAEDARVAAVNADNKAALANTATTNANDAAALANSKAGIAQTAADNANTKAGLADTAATNANTVATNVANAEVARVESGAEVKTNKTSDIEANKTSMDKYPTTKGVNDWSLLKFPLKGVAADYIALYSRKIATVVNGVITAIQDTWDAHNSRVTADSGAIRTQSLVKKYYDFCYDNQMFDSIKFAWLGDGGSKFRTSGIYTYFTKIYSMLGGNDAVQATSTNQPYLSGNIAPNEKYGLKNPNGGSNFLTHTPISFGAGDSWSVTEIIKLNGVQTIQTILTGGTNSKIRFTTLGKIEIVNESNTAVTGTGIYLKYIGKRTVFHFVANGNGSVIVYVNGVLSETITIASNMTFTQNNSNTNPFFGILHSDVKRAHALTQSQITAEYNLLRSYIPEIENVVIGTQTWATSNLEIVTTPQGNVIPEVQLSTNTEKITNGDMTNWGGSFPNEIPTNWFAFGTHTANNYVTQSPTGKCRIVSTDGSAAGISQVCLTVGKLYKLTFDLVTHVNGALEIVGLVNSAFFTSQIAIGTRTFYSIATATSLTFKRGTVADFTIDNVSVQEVGWSDSQNLYDYIYAQTSGTVEQKTYAAVKAAAMWCHYNNDVSIGAVYGKLYNWFAVKLMQMDIDYYNVANPSAVWGWRVPTSTDFTTLSTYLGGDAVSGSKLKKEGTTYWYDLNTDATNISGFSAISANFRDSSGGFSAAHAGFFSCISNSNNGIFLSRDSTALANSSAYVIADNRNGFSLRLIKN